MLKKYLDFATWLCRPAQVGMAGAGLGKCGRPLEQAEGRMGCRASLWGDWPWAYAFPRSCWGSCVKQQLTQVLSELQYHPPLPRTECFVLRKWTLLQPWQVPMPVADMVVLQQFWKLVTLSRSIITIMTGKPGSLGLKPRPPGNVHMCTSRGDSQQVTDALKFFCTGWDTAAAWAPECPLPSWLSQTLLWDFQDHSRNEWANPRYQRHPSGPVQGDSKGQERLACPSPWVGKESDTT